VGVNATWQREKNIRPPAKAQVRAGGQTF